MTEIVICGELDNSKTQETLTILRKKYQTNKVILLVNSNNREELLRLAPHLAEYKQIDNKTTIYVCKNFACNNPVTNPALIEDLL